MAIIRQRGGTYTVVPQDVTRDDRLSLKARGMLVTMLSLPDGWKFSQNGLEKILRKDGQASVRSALAELEESGYLVRERTRDDDGRLGTVEWCVYDYPQLENPIMDIPKLENHRQSITKESITKESTTKGSVRAHAFSAPGVEDVRAYADERGIAGFDAERFVDYYAAQGWKLSNGNRMRDWKAAVRNWARRDEQEREKSGKDDPFAQYRDMEARGLI
ncbi:MAG: hypothetical protein ACI364_06790 [Coriobacteriales bacterium]